MHVQTSTYKAELPPSKRTQRRENSSYGTYELRGMKCGATAVVLRAARNIAITDRIVYASANKNRAVRIFNLLRSGALCISAGA